MTTDLATLSYVYRRLYSMREAEGMLYELAERLGLRIERASLYAGNGIVRVVRAPRAYSIAVTDRDYKTKLTELAAHMRGRDLCEIINGGHWALQPGDEMSIQEAERAAICLMEYVDSMRRAT